MGPFVAAWLVGEGIITWRAVKSSKAPPSPGQLLVSSGLFVMLALLAESQKARTLAVTLAWGFDIAAFMNLYKVSANTGGTWPPALAPDTVIIPVGKPAVWTKPDPADCKGTGPSPGKGATSTTTTSPGKHPIA